MALCRQGIKELQVNNKQNEAKKIQLAKKQ